MANVNFSVIKNEAKNGGKMPLIITSNGISVSSIGPSQYFDVPHDPVRIMTDSMIYPYGDISASGTEAGTGAIDLQLSGGDYSDVNRSYKGNFIRVHGLYLTFSQSSQATPSPNVKFNVKGTAFGPEMLNYSASQITGLGSDFYNIDIDAILNLSSLGQSESMFIHLGTRATNSPVSTQPAFGALFQKFDASSLPEPDFDVTLSQVAIGSGLQVTAYLLYPGSTGWDQYIQAMCALGFYHPVSPFEDIRVQRGMSSPVNQYIKG